MLQQQQKGSTLSLIRILSSLLFFFYSCISADLQYCLSGDTFHSGERQVLPASPQRA